jgi:CRISPR-associated protein Cst2
MTRQYVIDPGSRLARAKALIHALVATLLKPTGAQRNTQNPHIVGCEGVITTSTNSLPAPTVSPLHDSYRDQVAQTCSSSQFYPGQGVNVTPFNTLAEGARTLAEIAAHLQVQEG